MSDTPNKDANKGVSSESEDTSKKPSPWFVTPMGDKEDRKNVQESESAKAEPVKLEPETTPVANDAAGETSSAATIPAAPKSAAPKSANSSPPSLKPSATTTPKANPFTDTSTITFDDDAKSKQVSTPMLVIDAVAALVAVTFAVLVLRDVMPFL